MTAPRSSLAILDALAPTRPVDSDRLARAHAEVEWAILEGGESRLVRRARAARRSRRVVGATAAAFGLVAVFTVAPLVAPDHHGSVGHGPVGLAGAEADGMGCELYRMPGAVDPMNHIARSQWSHMPGLRAVLFGIDGQRADVETVATSDAACYTDPPVAVLYAPDGSRGITVFRDVDGPAGTGGPGDIFHQAATVRTSVQGNEALVVTPPYGLHYVTWVDDAGVRWYVEANGMSAKALMRTLDGAIAPNGVGVVPDGYRSAPLPKVSTHGLMYRWEQSYGSTFLEVTSPAQMPVEAVTRAQNDVVLTDFEGQDAVYLQEGQGGSELRWHADGVAFRLIVPGADIDQIKSVASTIVPLTLPTN